MGSTDNTGDERELRLMENLRGRPDRNANLFRVLNSELVDAEEELTTLRRKVNLQSTVNKLLAKEANQWEERYRDCVQRSTGEVPRDADVASIGFDLAGTSIGKSGTRGGVPDVAGQVPLGLQAKEGTSGGITTTSEGYFWYGGTRVGGEEESRPQGGEEVWAMTHWPDGRKRQRPLPRVNDDGSNGEVTFSYNGER